MVYLPNARMWKEERSQCNLPCAKAAKPEHLGGALSSRCAFWSVGGCNIVETMRLYDLSLKSYCKLIYYALVLPLVASTLFLFAAGETRMRSRS
jgi:hypothetical protein